MLWVDIQEKLQTKDFGTDMGLFGIANSICRAWFFALWPEIDD